MPKQNSTAKRHPPELQVSRKSKQKWTSLFVFASSTLGALRLSGATRRGAAFRVPRRLLGSVAQGATEELQGEDVQRHGPHELRAEDPHRRQLGVEKAPGRVELAGVFFFGALETLKGDPEISGGFYWLPL